MKKKNALLLECDGINKNFYYIKTLEDIKKLMHVRLIEMINLESKKFMEYSFYINARGRLNNLEINKWGKEKLNILVNGNILILKDVDQNKFHGDEITNDFDGIDILLLNNFFYKKILKIKKNFFDIKFNF